jgi:hypothetical protein
MVRLLSSATNSLNQIARRVNETGSVYAADLDDLRGRYEELWSQAKEILRRLAVLKCALHRAKPSASVAGIQPSRAISTLNQNLEFDFLMGIRYNES